MEAAAWHFKEAIGQPDFDRLLSGEKFVSFGVEPKTCPDPGASDATMVV
jgi:hypothetical protein